MSLLKKSPKMQLKPFFVKIKYNFYPEIVAKRLGYFCIFLKSAQSINLTNLVTLLTNFQAWKRLAECKLALTCSTVK
jgi:hypothetical protein